jgi:hypothetical protein
VTVPVSVVRIKPVLLVATPVGMIWLAVVFVNVNVKPPIVMTHEGLIAPMVTEMLVGAIVTGVLAAIFKFCPAPVDAVLVPGLTRVFDTTPATIFAVETPPVKNREAMPPFPGVKPTLPEGSTAAYA